MSLAAAQQSSPDTFSWSRDITKACWLDGSVVECAKTAIKFWDNFKQVTRSAVRPSSMPVQLVRDGVWPETFTPYFFMLKGLANMPGPNLCKQLPAAFQTDPQELPRLTCNAYRELRPTSKFPFKGENDQLQRLREQLAAAGCMPLRPDPCAGLPSERAAEETTRDGTAVLAAFEEVPQLMVDVD